MLEEKHPPLRRLRSVPPSEPEVARVVSAPVEIEENERGKGVNRSLETIERALSNIADLNEHVQFYQALSGEFRKNLEDERRQRSEAQRRSRDLQELLATERERTAMAERRNMAAAELVNDLKNQLAAVQAETRRLVAAIGTLSSMRFDPGQERASRDRLAA